VANIRYETEETADGKTFVRLTDLDSGRCHNAYVDETGDAVKDDVLPRMISELEAMLEPRIVNAGTVDTSSDIAVADQIADPDAVAKAAAEAAAKAAQEEADATATDVDESEPADA
jgi:hypothetical protein